MVCTTYTPTMEQQKTITKQFFCEIHTQLQYVEGSFFMKDVNTQNLWTFELSTQEGLKNPIMKIVGFKQRDRQGSQNLNNDTFYRPPVTSAHCKISTEKNLVAFEI